MSQQDFNERDLRSLRIFCTVAQAGGFSAAEHRLNMSKASISRHIREVEERLGVRLCERGPTGFKLTVAGVVAVDLATNALKFLERIRPEIDSVRGVLSGTLSIGMVEHLINHHQCRIPEALAELKRRAPDVQPEIIVMTFTNLGQALRERRVDVAISGMYAKDRVFDYRTLFIEIHRVYSVLQAGDGPHNRLPLVYRPHPFVEQTLANHGFERGPDAGGLEAIALLAATGDYAGLLPEHYANLVTQRYAIEALPQGPVFHNTICAITEASRPLTRRIELFLDILDELHDVERGH
ncbi:LysR family transcriptional regulator [Paraburkholderia antibiotica]|uniref:LysR family transcriptional regulator n=1 Tax=Paraburkholderia antibiotica TaxID=2728839 RepID=A0A7Y0A2T0_9BURK|nr:LysR family transcriptional regulator [Paraburkholderia antibiotica]NML35383.1 LysR family transcriptional regulator [Paraburkholderia antibiotica]